MDSAGQAPFDPNNQGSNFGVGVAAAPMPIDQTPNNPVPMGTGPVLDQNLQSMSVSSAPVGIIQDQSVLAQLPSGQMNVQQPVVAQAQPDLISQDQMAIAAPLMPVQPVLNQSVQNQQIVSEQVVNQPIVNQSANVPVVGNQIVSMPAAVTSDQSSLINTQAEKPIENLVLNPDIPVVQVEPVVSSIVPVVAATGWGDIVGSKNVEVKPEALVEIPKELEVKNEEIKLGTISGNLAGNTITQKPERVEGLVSGTNMNVAKMLQDEKKKSAEMPVEVQKEEIKAKNPLADLYQHIEDMSKNSQIILDQELEAQRQHKTVEQMRDEALGWQITGKITNVLMIFSWVMAVISLFFPYIFKVKSSDKGFSADFILFIVTIMILLVCTILSFWITSNKVVKMVTWGIFVFFVLIFILISFKSGGVIGNDIPVMNVFLNRFSL